MPNHQSLTEDKIRSKSSTDFILYISPHALSGYSVKQKDKDYYKCGVKGCKTNISSQVLHDAYAEVLDTLVLPDEWKSVLESVARHKFEERVHSNDIDRDLVEKNLATIDTKLKKAQMRWAIDEIDRDVYESVQAQLKAEKREAEALLAKLDGIADDEAEYLSNVIDVSQKMGSYWRRMDFDVCQNIQNLVFPTGVKWDNVDKAYRTDGMNKFFRQIAVVGTSVEASTYEKRTPLDEMSVLVAYAIEKSELFLKSLAEIYDFADYWDTYGRVVFREERKPKRVFRKKK